MANSMVPKAPAQAKGCRPYPPAMVAHEWAPSAAALPACAGVAVLTAKWACCSWLNIITLPMIFALSVAGLTGHLSPSHVRAQGLLWLRALAALQHEQLRACWRAGMGKGLRGTRRCLSGAAGTARHPAQPVWRTKEQLSGLRRAGHRHLHPVHCL